MIHRPVGSGVRACVCVGSSIELGTISLSVCRQGAPHYRGEQLGSSLGSGCDDQRWQPAVLQEVRRRGDFLL